MNVRKKQFQDEVHVIITLSEKIDGKQHMIYTTENKGFFGIEKDPELVQFDEWKGEIRTMDMLMNIVYNVCRVWLVMYVHSGGIFPVIEVIKEPKQSHNCSFGYMKEFVTKLMAYVYRQSQPHPQPSR
jgi:hypothetical protein